MARHLIPIHRGHIVSDPFNFLRQEIDRIFETSTSIQGITPDFEVKETKEGETFHISERCFGSFSRSLKLPYKPEEKKISASFKDGVLKVIIPRPTNLKPNVHKIQIQK